MCGIAGIFNFNYEAVEKENLSDMLEEMKRRGPDDRGVYIDKNIGIGQVRLSIIDLSERGHQPMFSNDSRYAIVFNGEIYNYLELKEQLRSKYDFRTGTDTEVILAAYINWGEACVDRFNGMWAFAIYDTISGEMFLSRDRYGVKPLYYYVNDKTFVFASEIKAIHKLNKQTLHRDDKTIFEYLVYNRTDQSCDTFVKEIKRVQHGYNISIKKGSIEFKKWYDLKLNSVNPWSSPEEYIETFTSAISLRLRSDVPVGVCLSGGLDSSGVTTIISDVLGKKDVFAFSAVYGANKRGDESKYINLYSNLVNLKLIFPTEDTFFEDLDDFMDCHFEPVHTMSIYSQFKVMKDASKYVTVALDGQGADEQLAGYHYFFSSYFRELLTGFKLLKFCNEFSSYYKQHHSLFALKYMMFYLLPDLFKNKLGALKNSSLTESFFKVNNKGSDISKLLFNPKSLNESLFQHFEYKLEHNLKWNDLNSMYFSLELREPFLDYRLVERTLASPSHFKINKGFTKWIYRESMKGVLNDLIRLRQDKVGFDNPADEWLKTLKMKELVYDTLNSKIIIDAQILNIKECSYKYQKHLNGEIDISKEIWKWIHLAKFLEKCN